MTAYLVASTTAVPIVGKLSDIYGRKSFYIAGIAVFLTGSVLAGQSQTMNQLIAFRAVQGLGGGVMMAIALVSIADLFPPSERGKYQGIVAAVFGCGLDYRRLRSWGQLGSRDHNGISVEKLRRTLGVNEDELKSLLAELVQDREISLEFGNIHPNPYIKAFPPQPVDHQIGLLRDADLASQPVCVYPSAELLELRVDQADYEGMPFSLRLALGEPQLVFETFELSVLEFYRNDPRYEYSTDDIRGHISVRDNASGTLPESDQTVVRHFGFAHDSDLNRAVAVFLRYLSDLTPEHQQIWKAKQKEGKFRLHPDFARTTGGEWPKGVSVFQAVLLEIVAIRQRCELMGWVPLFKRNYLEGEKPKNFGFLIRPTRKEFEDFIQTSDKVLSENLDRKFFKGRVDLRSEETRKDGKVVVSEKGTITLLEEWLSSEFTWKDDAPVKETIAAFRRVRDLRSRPSHVLDDDTFDQYYYH